MKIIYGPKGTGKTKAIIDCANKTKDTAKGHVIYITDNSRNSLEIKHPIRLLDVTGFSIKDEEALRGFISGIVAASGDNEYVFIDGVARISGKPLSELAKIFEAIENLEKQYGVTFVLTCSSAKEDLPEFVLKYVE